MSLQPRHKNGLQSEDAEGETAGGVPALPALSDRESAVPETARGRRVPMLN